MKLSKLIFPLVASAIAISSSTPSFAQTTGMHSVRVVRTSDVSGNTAELPIIKVWPGHGTSISFYETGETIQRIWLDDPKQIIVDVDGCLEGLSQKQCKNPGAGLIHLRQIDKLAIKGIPSAKSGALLTVITEGVGGKKTYTFSVVMGTGVPNYASITIAPDVKANTPAPAPDAIAIRSITQGIQLAQRNQWITPTNPLWPKLQQLVAELQSGKNLTAAAQSAGVSQKLVERLLQLGGKPMSIPAPRQYVPTSPESETASARFTRSR